jgi:hypothetical protein
VEQVEQPDGTEASEQHPRIRFARRELVKVLTALERVDGHELNAAIRVEQLEEQLADAREEARRWRQGTESMQALLADTFGAEQSERVEQLGAAIREWVGKS